MARFLDHRSAGAVLAARLRSLDAGDAVVLALPTGGVIVAAEVARALDRPLDLVDLQEVLARCADLPGGTAGSRAPDPDRTTAVTAAALCAPEAELRTELERHRPTLASLMSRLRAVQPAEPLLGRTAIVVDDGVFATAPLAAAVHYARGHGAATVIAAVPAGTPALLATLGEIADETMCVEIEPPGAALSDVYDQVSVVTHDDVLDAVVRHRSPGA